MRAIVRTLLGVCRADLNGIADKIARNEQSVVGHAMRIQSSHYSKAPITSRRVVNRLYAMVWVCLVGCGAHTAVAGERAMTPLDVAKISVVVGA